MKDKSQVKIFIKTWDSFILIPVQDILFCEKDSGYTRIHIRNQKSILASDSLNECEAMLSENGFFRIHENYLINLWHITGFEDDPDSNVLLEYNHRIPAESRRQLELVERMKRVV